jgi:hypothetical protein
MRGSLRRRLDYLDWRVSLGTILGGTFWPPVFVWLVIGAFLQQRSSNNEVLRIPVRQSEEMAANELHARQGTFLRISARVYRQLGTIAGFLYISNRGANAQGVVANEAQSRS